MVATAAAAADEPAPAFTTTASGLQYAITHHGDGPSPTAGQVVIAHYVGSLPDGTVFDSTRERDQPFSFTLGRKQVIPGWDEGFALLHVGDQATLIVPPDLAYGDQTKGAIPADSTLRFEVELLDLKVGSLADKLQDTIEADGVAGMTGFLAAYAHGDFAPFYVSESQLNRLGYRYLSKNQLPEALAVLKWNTELFPTSGNVYDSYGEALLSSGDQTAAQANYAKSLELDPSNRNAERVLAELAAAAASPAGQAQFQARRDLGASLDLAFEASHQPDFTLAPLKAQLVAFLDRYPDDESAGGLVRNYFYLAETLGVPTALAEWQAFADHPNPKVREAAAAKLKLAELIREPLTMTFTAADGRRVDLAALRGKVVLIDFWATWCGPCIAELPNVKQVYAAYHDRGFEIVGIALENGKLAPNDAPEAVTAKLAAARQVLLDFTAENEMPWPQYFDGKWWQNEIAGQYGIRAIPAMFVLDQTGRVESTNARGEKLEAEVRRLLGL